ncbi:MAG: hypothetical protein KIG91_09500 [Treponema sp.]|nr:hypothetical protein [Treponema sp.]
MKISESFLLKLLVFSLTLTFFGILPGSQELNAASKKKKPKKVEQPVEIVAEPQVEVLSSENSATKLVVPKKRNTYFSKINESIVDGIENGSPSSVMQALNSLKKTEGEVTENEKVLAYVGTEIMNICWPSVNFSGDLPEIENQTPYTGALDFVRRGFFDSSTGNVDFLSSILPCLVLVSGDPLSETDMTQVGAAFEKAQEYRTDSVLMDYLSGLYYRRKGDFEKASVFFEKLYVQNSGIYEIAKGYAEIKYSLKDYDSAFQISSMLLSKNPSSLDLLRLNARIAFALKNYDMAEEFVGRGLQQMPNNLEFLLFRAKILVEKNDYIHAVSLLDMYARQNDTNAEYLLLRTRVQLDWSKNISLATETIEKALTLYPENQEALLLAARIASITDAPVAGKYADELVAGILEKNPDNVTAQIYALNALEKREMWQNAYEISKKLSVSENVSSDVVSKHVEICLQLGKTGEALEFSQKAYEQNPQDEMIVQSYILAQIAGGNKNQSLVLINSLLENSTPKMKSYLYYRRSFLQATEAACLSDLRSSLISNPRNSDALFRLYEIYYGKDDYKKAQYYLKQVVALNPNDSTFRKLNESLTKLLQ